MGRGKQFQKDKMYITPTEYANGYGGKKAQVESKPFSTLQFYCCNISLQPWKTPMCTPNGAIFDAVHLLAWYKKYKVSPVTGEAMPLSDLIYLNFAKNSDGKFHCPITSQIFTEHTHIVCIRQTGNVYAFKAIEELNIRTKNWKELITGEPFTRKDIISLQDPNNYQDPSTYHFIKNGLTVQTKAKESNDPTANIVVNSTSQSVFKEMKEKDALAKVRKQLLKEQESSEEEEAIPVISKYKGSDSASMTSTAFTPSVKKEKGWKEKKTTEKGYVRLVTNKGNLNFVIHCDLVPLASENFLTHCENNYYKYTKFHRNIKHFMIQTGDPTGTGKGGQSIWGKPFPDEFNDTLKHDGEGVLAMANSGPNTNGSQFYITYKSAPHLNKKHTVFGSLVGGTETLHEFANFESDDNDRPIEDIVILETIVYTNPLNAASLKEAQQVVKDTEKKEKEKGEYGAWLSNPSMLNKKGSATATSNGIGKYITNTQPSTKKRSALDFGMISQTSESSKKKKVDGTAGTFANF
jgi:peptidyl-prolyl cis-trans isomerase-like protein 2